jgi:hypothetical protein
MHISQKILKNYEVKADKLSTDSRNSAKSFIYVKLRFVE